MTLILAIMGVVSFLLIVSLIALCVLLRRRSRKAGTGTTPPSLSLSHPTAKGGGTNEYGSVVGVQRGRRSPRSPRRATPTSALYTDISLPPPADAPSMPSGVSEYSTMPTMGPGTLGGVDAAGYELMELSPADYDRMVLD